MEHYGMQPEELPVVVILLTGGGPGVHGRGTGASVSRSTRHQKA